MYFFISFKFLVFQFNFQLLQSFTLCLRATSEQEDECAEAYS